MMDGKPENLGVSGGVVKLVDTQSGAVLKRTPWASEAESRADGMQVRVLPMPLTLS